MVEGCSRKTSTSMPALEGDERGRTGMKEGRKPGLRERHKVGAIWGRGAVLAG